MATILQTCLSWPSDIRYLTQPVHSTNLSQEQVLHLTTRQDKNLPIIKLPLHPPSHIEIRSIKDPLHPAHNQYGLFATQQLTPNTLIIPYLGLVHTNDSSDTDSASDYDLSLDREAGLSVDANEMGNEARMTNDYRGVPRPMAPTPLKKGEKLGPNAEFRDLWFEYEGDLRQSGEMGIGIFVLGSGRSGKRSVGILKGEEILVNYGKGFWKERA